MNPMLEQTVTGDSLKQEQRDLTRELIDAYCEKHGATVDHFSEASGIDGHRLRGYMTGSVSELTEQEMGYFFSFADKLEKAVK